MAASPAISVSGLTKACSETTGIFDVGLEVPAGTVMALLGPDGAGKTTALRILSTLPELLGRLKFRAAELLGRLNIWPPEHLDG